MIKTFRSKRLRDLFERGRAARISPALRQRVIRRLDVLDQASALGNLDLPGLDCHPLHGSGRHAIRVNGPWRITFRWQDGDAYDVDLEQYH
jgi:toxin HigB-1